jgi:hypothetical protein
LKKNGRKSMVLRVPRSNDGRLFENLFEQFLNRELFSVRKRKASGGHDHYYLSVVGEKGSECLGGALLDRLDFMRRAFNQANDLASQERQKNIIQIERNVQLQREINVLRAKALGFDQLTRLLNFIDGLGPDTVEGVGMVVAYARAAGLMEKPGMNVKKDLESPKIEIKFQNPEAKNGKL